MLDVFRVAGILTAHAVRTHGSEVSLIACYGSRVTGTASAHSDLDLFYTPVEGADPPIARGFIVEGIPFDFWPIRWETLEGFATGRLRGWAVAPSLVLNARPLYARSEEDRARLDGLKQRVLDLQKPEARKEMVRRALGAFKAVLFCLGNLRLACADDGFASVRWASWNVVTSCVECLALANQTTFPRGWGYVLEQLPLLARRPEGIEESITAIATSADPGAVAAAAERLALGTRGVLRREQDAFPPEATPSDAFGGSYPETREHVNKVQAACERRRPVAASYEASFLQADVATILAATDGGLSSSEFNLYGEYARAYQSAGLPDLMRATGPTLDLLAAQTTRFDARLRQWLQADGLSLHTYETLAEFERSLDA